MRRYPRKRCDPSEMGSEVANTKTKEPETGRAATAQTQAAHVASVSFAAAYLQTE